MPPISFKERQQVNHKLKQLGFGGLDDANILSQIATLYTTHDAFRGLLMSTAPDQRRIAYEALKPHLCFVPKPLDVYEMEAKQKYEREQWDTIDPDNPHFPKAFRPGEVETEEYRIQRLASEAIAQNAHEKHGGLELVCTKCTVAQLFRAKTRKDAEQDARSAGWRWAERNGVMKTYCPKHVPGRATMTLTCSNVLNEFSEEVCGRSVKLHVWDQQDGYAAARLAGWTIEDVTKCPRCSVKLVTLQ